MTTRQPIRLTGGLVEDGFQIASHVESAARSLGRKGIAFAECGNMAHADVLFEYEQALVEAAAAIRELVGNETSRGLAESQANCGRILSGLLNLARQ